MDCPSSFFVFNTFLLIWVGIRFVSLLFFSCLFLLISVFSGCLILLWGKELGFNLQVTLKLCLSSELELGISLKNRITGFCWGVGVHIGVISMVGGSVKMD